MKSTTLPMADTMDEYRSSSKVCQDRMLSVIGQLFTENLYKFRFQFLALQVCRKNLAVGGNENDCGDARDAVEVASIALASRTAQSRPRKLMLFKGFQPCVAVFVARNAKEDEVPVFVGGLDFLHEREGTDAGATP